MIVEVSPDYLLSKVSACPDWCTLDRDHDVDQIAKGERSRIHFSPEPEGSCSVLFDDNPDSATPWYFDPPEIYMFGQTPGELANAIRDHAAALLRTAEWLEEIR